MRPLHARHQVHKENTDGQGNSISHPLFSGRFSEMLLYPCGRLLLIWNRVKMREEYPTQYEYVLQYTSGCSCLKKHLRIILTQRGLSYVFKISTQTLPWQDITKCNFIFISLTNITFWGTSKSRIIRQTDLLVMYYTVDPPFIELFFSNSGSCFRFRHRIRVHCICTSGVQSPFAPVVTETL